MEISGEAQKSLITQILGRLHRLERAKGRFSELSWIPKETANPPSSVRCHSPSTDANVIMAALGRGAPLKLRGEQRGVIVLVYLTATVVVRVMARRIATWLRILLSIPVESPPQFPPAAVVSLV